MLDASGARRRMQVFIEIVEAGDATEVCGAGMASVLTVLQVKGVFEIPGTTIVQLGVDGGFVSETKKED